MLRFLMVKNNMHREYRVDTARTGVECRWVDSEWQRLILKPCSVGMNAAGAGSHLP